MLVQKSNIFNILMDQPSYKTIKFMTTDVHSRVFFHFANWSDQTKGRF